MMTKTLRIVAAAILAMIAASLFYFIVPITKSFIISHVFVCVSIVIIAAITVFINTKKSKAISGIAYVLSATVYSITCVGFSVIAYFRLYWKWTFVGHGLLLIAYLILMIMLTWGSDYTSKIDEIDNAKRLEFEKEKQDYWK